MYPTLDPTQMGTAAAVASPADTSAELARQIADTSAKAAAAFQKRVGFRHKWSVLRYILVGTGAYAPPIGKFKV